MKKYVVALISFFENNIEQFIIEAENEYEAVLKANIEFESGSPYQQDLIDAQKSDEYPKDIKSLELHFSDCEMDFSVIEI